MNERNKNHIIYIINVLIIIWQILATIFLYQHNDILGYTFLSLYLSCAFIMVIYSYFKKTIIIIQNISFILCLFVGLICGWVLFGIKSIIGGFLLSTPYTIYSIYNISLTLFLYKNDDLN